MGFRGLQLGEGQANLFNGIAKTIDGGQTWKIVFKESTQPAANLTPSWLEQRAPQRQRRHLVRLALQPRCGAQRIPDVAYATDLFRTYRTLDGGATWQEMNSRQLSDGSWTSRGLDVTTDYGVQFDPSTPGTSSSTTPISASFRAPTAANPGAAPPMAFPIAGATPLTGWPLIPARRGLMWGAFSGKHDLPRPKDWRTTSPSTFTGGVAVSTDGGLHWTPSNTGTPAQREMTAWPPWRPLWALPAGPITLCAYTMSHRRRNVNTRRHWRRFRHNLSCPVARALTLRNKSEDRGPVGYGGGMAAADRDENPVVLSRIYTRTGDDGTTALGDLSRAAKTDLRLAAYADVDEANCAIGVAVTLGGLAGGLRELLIRIQNELFDVGADLCNPVTPAPAYPPLRVAPAYIDALEEACDQYNAELPTLRSFVLPGGTPGRRCCTRPAPWSGGPSGAPGPRWPSTATP